MFGWRGAEGLGAWGAERLVDDPARLELLPVRLLRTEAAAAGLAARRACGPERGRRLLIHARALRDYGRRTGALQSLARAARAAETALDQARCPVAVAAARAELVGCALDAAELGGDEALLAGVGARLVEAGAAAPTDPVGAARLAGLRAAYDGRRALETGTIEAAQLAAAALDAAAVRLARAVRSRPELTGELAAVRCARAELLTGFALRLRDASLAARAALDMAGLTQALDPDRAPLAAARAARLHGEAMTAQGELTGDAALLTRAADLLAATLAEVPAGHSPMDRARLARALGHAARALGECCDNPDFYDIAEQAFGAGALELSQAPATPLGAFIAFERSMNAARRGEAGGDRHARALAERALKAELVALDARKSPTAWAATQVALARLYGESRRAEASVALSAALDVFTEEGLAELAQTTADELRRLAA